MEDIKSDVQKIYNDLPKEEKRALRKEYFNSINPRAKIMRWISMFFLLIMIVLIGFWFYYMARFLFYGEKVFPLMFFMSGSASLIGGIILLISHYVFLGLWKWLEREKNIILKQAKKNKKSID